MACENCRTGAIADNVDGLEYDVDRLERVTRNQSWVLIGVTVIVYLIVARLAAKGVLSWPEILGEVTADAT